MRDLLSGLWSWYNETWGFSILKLWPLAMDALERDREKPSLRGAALAGAASATQMALAIGASWLGCLPEASLPIRVLLWALAAYFVVSATGLALRAGRFRR